MPIIIESEIERLKKLPINICDCKICNDFYLQSLIDWECPDHGHVNGRSLKAMMIVRDTVDNEIRFRQSLVYNDIVNLKCPQKKKKRGIVGSESAFAIMKKVNVVKNLSKLPSLALTELDFNEAFGA